MEKLEKDGKDLAFRLMALFDILNTSMDKRANNLSDDLRNFKYINGKLFEEKLKLAGFDFKMRKILFECCEFD